MWPVPTPKRELLELTCAANNISSLHEPLWVIPVGALYFPSTLQQHIFAQLKYELLNCKSACRLCGLTGAPKEYRKRDMVSLDALSESDPLYERAMAA
mgnify:CR=1 FL=1